ncbi:MAG TPA: LacI family DNA-binding transcriptional regulator [Candidatus Aquilonibacter sp.]|nr:LacI family DNA-binding transcriptional regulator [Candidatus Aquilonibacter sp.]
MARSGKRGGPPVVTLKSVAEHLGLTPGTVSSVLNDAPSARSIPLKTKNLIRAAAKELNYQPNYFARSLRKKRTYTLGVIAEEIGDSYGSQIITGIEEYLRGKDYSFLTMVHRHDPELLQRHLHLLAQRGVEGIITVDTSLQESPALPTIAVPGHRKLKGVTNLALDHEKAAFLALDHLMSLSHRHIAFMKGNPISTDAKDRWQAICNVARQLHLEIDPDLTVQIDIDDPSPQLGYPFGKLLLARRKLFTALFAYNDISAIGAIRAFQEAGLRVPQDISVIGFDDIPWAAFQSPSLTTVRQPLIRMGQVAAQTLVQRIEGNGEYPPEITIAPELVLRESTGKAREL